MATGGHLETWPHSLRWLNNKQKSSTWLDCGQGVISLTGFHPHFITKSEVYMNLNDLKPLTTAQYDQCKSTALKRVQSHIGSKPTRKDFERELGTLWSVLDILALIVFVAALLVSSAHIMQHMGGLADSSFEAQTNGTRLGRDLWIGFHQWGYIALSEASMILFMTLFARSKSRNRQLVFLILAVVAASFVVIANVSSGTGLLESIMPPIFTLGIGFHLESKIVSSLERSQEVTQRYLAAMNDYEAATKNPESHSKFHPYLMQSLRDKLISLKVNRNFTDAPAAFWVAACKREMAREQWVFAQGDSSIEIPPPDNQPGDEQRLPFGNTVPTLVDRVSTQMNAHANGHGGKTITEN